MKITDETLSAFLDSELSDAEMEAVRDKLEADPSLTDRLAELASVDATLQAHYGSIDDRPMPESVTRMLEDPSSGDTAPEQDNVVRFPWWRTIRGQAGKAVAAAVIAGVALMQWFGMPSNGDPAWQEVAQVLENQPSGQMHQLDSQSASGANLTPRLTFQTQDGQWCRQFRLNTETAASEQIACRGETGEWEQVARAEAGPAASADAYQTASGGSALDPTLERMMSGAPVGPEEERELLVQQWDKQ